MTLKCTMILGDCLDAMTHINASSVDMCFADLPYTVRSSKVATRNAWDVPVDLSRLWLQLRRLAAPTFLSAMTCQMRLAAKLIESNESEFLYDLVWHKNSSATFLQAKRRPLCYHESVLIFRSGHPKYNPIMVPRTNGKARTMTHPGRTRASSFNLSHKPIEIEYADVMYPSTVIKADSVPNVHSRHPTQKPVGLLDWLIRTYSNPGDTVLDPVSGSFTTSVAACLSGRSSVGIEKDPTYFEAGVERVQKTVVDNKLGVKIEVRR